MIQNVLLTAFAPLKNKNEITCWENRPFTTVWPENMQQKSKGITRTIKKKQKRQRTAFSTDQIRTLERTFLSQRYIDSEKRAELSKTLNIGDKCIKIWFQNRRMKEKRESSESSYESSSESTGNETPAEIASPPLQVSNDHQIEQQPNQCSYYNTEQMYQLPSYFNQTPSQENTQAPDLASHFYTDTNVYQTQYYPYDLTFTQNQGNFNQFGNEINHCWSANYYPYYTPM